MRNFSIKSNIFLLLALSIVGLMIPAFIVLKSQMLDDKKEKTKNLVESAYSVLVYYKKTVDDGKMNEDDAKKAALSVIKTTKKSIFGLTTLRCLIQKWLCMLQIQNLTAKHSMIKSITVQQVCKTVTMQIWRAPEGIKIYFRHSWRCVKKAGAAM